MGIFYSIAEAHEEGGSLLSTHNLLHFASIGVAILLTIYIVIRDKRRMKKAAEKNQ